MGYSTYHMFFEDLDIGVEYTSGGRTITQVDIVNFAGFSGDFNPIHVDHTFAATTPFRRPIAHGFGVFSIASGLGVQTPPVRTVALLGVREWQFILPVFPGDTIKVRTKVVEKSLRGRGKRGEVIWQRQIVNQEDKVVQQGLVTTLVECRPLPKPEAAATVGREVLTNGRVE